MSDYYDVPDEEVTEAILQVLIREDDKVLKDKLEREVEEILNRDVEHTEFEFCLDNLYYRGEVDYDYKKHKIKGEKIELIWYYYTGKG